MAMRQRTSSRLYPWSLYTVDPNDFQVSYNFNKVIFCE